MSIASLIRRMLEAGAPPEAIAMAVEAIEEGQELLRRKDEEAALRREKDRDRKRAKKAEADAVRNSTEIPRNSTGTAAEIPDETPVPPSSPSLSPTPPISTPTSPLYPPNEKARAQKRATRLSEDWTPRERNIADAIATGLPAALIDREAGKFRDFWLSKAGKDAVKLDWDATWRNWCRNAVERLPMNQRGPHAQPSKHNHAPQVSRPNLMAGFARVAGEGHGGSVQEQSDYPSPIDDAGTLLDFRQDPGTGTFR